MSDEPLVVPDLGGTPAVDGSHELMNISKGPLHFDLDTVDGNGKRETFHLGIRKTRVVSEAQFRSVRIQRLLSGPEPFLVDVTASKARRLQREKELGGNA